MSNDDPIPTVRDIITAYLELSGYDGLVGSECACNLDDLMPCEGCDGLMNSADCQPGYLADCDCGEEHGFHISTRKGTA